MSNDAKMTTILRVLENAQLLLWDLIVFIKFLQVYNSLEFLRPLYTKQFPCTIFTQSERYLFI